MNIGNENISKIYAGSTEISKAYLGSEQVYGGSQPTPSYIDMPFTIEALDNLTLSFCSYNTGVIGSFYVMYNVNDTGWNRLTSSTPTISVNSGDTIQFLGNNETMDGFTFESDKSVNVYGNLCSLLVDTNYTALTDFSTFNYSYTFSDIFGNYQGSYPNNRLRIVDAGNLILQATVLTNGCYQRMFNGCTELVTAPALPAASLVDECYFAMFSECSNLNYIKCLATYISASNCTHFWTFGVAQSGTFVKAAGVDWSGKTDFGGIPSGWTVIEE